MSRTYIYIFILAILLSASTMIHGNQTWGETFDSEDDWRLESYDLDENYAGIPTDKEYVNISNGYLKFYDPDPGNHTQNYLPAAGHESTIIYGNWSFDFNPGEYPMDMIVAYMYTMETEDFTGEVINYNWTGYGLRICSQRLPGLHFSPGVRIFKYLQPDSSTNLLEKKFDEDITGWNHVDIIREENGTTRVLINKEEVLNYPVPNYAPYPPWTESEMFWVFNFRGNPMVDNIVVEDYWAIEDPADVVETDISLVGYGGLIFLLPVIQRHRKDKF